MAKRDDDNGKKRSNLDRMIMRNWIICGATLIAIIALTYCSK